MTELQLETAAGNHISNEQIQEIAVIERNQYIELEKQYESDHGISVFYRSSLTPIYNCHGLTFAARRTGIFRSQMIRQILADDSYVMVGDVNNYSEVMPGDIILYVANDGDIEHSGLVLTQPSGNELGIPFVCSKWGKYAEVIHPANKCPYDFSNSEYHRVVY